MSDLVWGGVKRMFPLLFLDKKLEPPLLLKKKKNSLCNGVLTYD
jgi:hypothetical protein